MQDSYSFLFYELESEVRIVGTNSHHSEDKGYDGAERFLANLLHQDLVLAGLLHVAILITMNYEMRTEIEK